MEKGILDGDTEFENSDEIYEAIGHILHEIAAEKSEDDIKFVFFFNVFFFLGFLKLCFFLGKSAKNFCV